METGSLYNPWKSNGNDEEGNEMIAKLDPLGSDNVDDNEGCGICVKLGVMLSKKQRKCLIFCGGGKPTMA